MLLEFNTYLNVQLRPGEYYVHVVNVDEERNEQGVMQIVVKFATAEGFILKEYLLDEHGMQSFYEDFIADFYWESLSPIDHENMESGISLDTLSSEFDTNTNLLHREFKIVVENFEQCNLVTEVAPCKISYSMSQRYIKPFVDNLNGLQGKEAETMFLNID
jgi:hypothetical protein